MRKHVLVIAALTFVLVGAVAVLVAREVAQAKRDYAIWEAVSSPTPIAAIDFDPNKPVADHTETRGFSRRHVGWIDDLRSMFPSGQSREKNYPLIIAARDGSPETVQRLIDSGADIEAPGFHGTPLMYAVGSDWRRFYSECKIENVRVLLAAGANVCVRDADWGSLLNVASIAELFHESPGYDAEPMLRFLILEAWDDCLLALDSAGTTPLMFVSSVDAAPCDLVEMLLRNGDDARAMSGNGRTALMHASITSQNPLCVLRTLLAHGADPNTKDAYGKTALDYAREFGAHQETIELLEAAMRDAASAQ